MNDEITRGGYAISDHKAILADSILEINELSLLVKSLRGDLELIQEDIDTLNRTLHEFGGQIKTVKLQVSEHLANVAVTAFDEQLMKVEDMVGRMLRGEKLPTAKKKRFWQR